MAAEPRPTRPPERRSSRGAVLDAALEIADAEGLDAVTMRRVAAKLDIPVMSLYGFVRTKTEMLEELGARALGDLREPTDGDDPWEARLSDLTRRLRNALTAHPGVVELILTQAAPSHSFDHVRETILQTLHTAGFGPRDALNAMGALVSYALGYAVASGRQIRFPELTTNEPERLGRLHPAEFPRLVAVAEEYPSHLSDDAFEIGLGHLIGGLRDVRLRTNRESG